MSSCLTELPGFTDKILDRGIVMSVTAGGAGRYNEED